jgi:CBS domain-containing protein
MVTVGPRHRSGIFLESTSDEALGVLAGEDRPVKDVMSREVVVIDASTSVKEAAEIMRNSHLPTLIVCRGDELMGALTEHDVVVSGAARTDLSRSNLHEIMTKREVIRCHQDAILADALRAMTAHHAHAVPVVDEKGDLVGVISLMEAVGALPPETAATWVTKMRESRLSSHPSPNDI